MSSESILPLPVKTQQLPAQHSRNQSLPSHSREHSTESQKKAGVLPPPPPKPGKPPTKLHYDATTLPYPASAVPHQGGTLPYHASTLPHNVSTSMAHKTAAVHTLSNSTLPHSKTKGRNMYYYQHKIWVAKWVGNWNQRIQPFCTLPSGLVSSIPVEVTSLVLFPRTVDWVVRLFMESFVLSCVVFALRRSLRCAQC